MSYAQGSTVHIRVIDNSFDPAYRDTTIGKVYEGTFYKKGSKDDLEYPCVHDSIYFTDDSDETVGGWLWLDINSGVIELVN